jgi:hypothetical protein
MKWLRKSLLMASVGYLGAATASAQSPDPGPRGPGVSLCRPQPLIEQIIPARFVVRGQVDDEPPERKVSVAVDWIVPGEVAVLTPFAADGNERATPVAPQKLGSVLPDAGESPKATPRAPLGKVQQYNAWTGKVEGVPAGTPVVYETAPGMTLGQTPVNPHFYARAEYLLWWTNGYHLPILVTTGPATQPEDVRGALGVPGTVPLYGGNSTNIGPQSGGRFSGMYSLDPCGNCGIEGNYFFLGRKNDNFAADSSQYPVLARPFFNVNTGMNDRELTATPGTQPGDLFKLRGSVKVNNFSDLQGAELNLRNLICCDCRYAVYGFAGFRWLDLHEALSITENVVSVAAVPGFTIFTPGNQIIVNDTFNTRNRFYGGQLGVDGEYRTGRWFIGGRAQIALGVTNETVDISGFQSVTTLAGQRQTFTGGLLALPSNIGQSTVNRFSAVPQVGLKIGYNVTENLRIFAGYEFLYWSNVLRPGDQVDTTLNVSQIPNFNTTPPNPAFAPPSNVVRPIVPLTSSNYFAHGITAGLEWRY